ncbi:hypothetical protein JHK87_006332 [Glycine soja]|nr:hypothetical protein JHK87_006332 [Glycine soja]
MLEEYASSDNDEKKGQYSKFWNEFGSDEHLERKILDPERLSRVESIFGNLSETIKIYGQGLLHGYLDQLGIASSYNTKVYCRQTLIGGNYGLLNATTFAPNPDYYSFVASVNGKEGSCGLK